jgi:hypothetical protein
MQMPAAGAAQARRWLVRPQRRHGATVFLRELSPGARNHFLAFVYLSNALRSKIRHEDP